MTLIEVRYGHRRRSYRGLAVHLGIVTGGNLRIVAAQPDSTHREAGVASSLGNPGFYQQGQRSAARADKNEFSQNVPVVAAFFVPDPQAPQSPFTAQIL